MDGGLATLYRDVFLNERCSGTGGGAGGDFRVDTGHPAAELCHLGPY